jgi:ABC-type lipoprotein export system ATPase subunit
VTSASPLLVVTELIKEFRAPGGEIRRVLDLPSFRLESGEQAALRGASGSGKTTLLHLIAGVLVPDRGTVRVEGAEISSLPEAARDAVRARRIGYVFQSIHLLRGYTALENVEMAMRFGPGADPARARALLSRVGLGDRMRDLPRQLSSGQQQRVAVARALANRPVLVLADEPTAHLDPELSVAVLALLREVCAENAAALLLVTHDRDALAGFPRVEDFAALNRACSAPAADRDAAHPQGAP